MQSIPPLWGMPMKDNKTRYGLESYQVLFSMLDRLVYEELIEPYLELFVELVEKYGKEYKGPYEVSWGDKRLPGEELPKRFFRGNEMAAKISEFNRASLRRHERPGDDEEVWYVRCRKTVTNIALIAGASGPKIPVFRARNMMKTKKELMSYVLKDRNRTGVDLVFYRRIGELLYVSKDDMPDDHVELQVNVFGNSLVYECERLRRKILFEIEVKGNGR